MIDPCTHYFTRKSSGPSVPLHLMRRADFLNPKNKALRDGLKSRGFDGTAGQILSVFDAHHHLQHIYVAIPDTLANYSLAGVLGSLEKSIDSDTYAHLTLSIKGALSPQDATCACIGYALGGYKFSAYKTKSKYAWPKLVWPDNADKKFVQTMLQAVFMARDAINTPANDMGPDDLVALATNMAQTHAAKMHVTRGESLRKNFPLVHAVGRAAAAHRAPCLIDIHWGNPKHKRLTLVGKGVVFDTGGLDIKPSSGMLIMKKDMSGAAHMLALAHVIMSLKLPVNLRVIIPVAENSISGDAFRPKDILRARNSKTVEIGNTDAEGRLLLADALTAACDDKPDLIIDMATLTGAAHVAVGHHLASLFARRDQTADGILTASRATDDPLWRMPLWDGYRKSLHAAIADLNSTGDPNPAGSITAALFLDNFVTTGLDWVHIDFCAWEYNGRPGRPVGGTEFALYALTQYLQDRYA